jgi:hypothetical protein
MSSIHLCSCLGKLMCWTYLKILIKPRGSYRTLTTTLPFARPVST